MAWDVKTSLLVSFPLFSTKVPLQFPLAQCWYKHILSYHCSTKGLMLSTEGERLRRVIKLVTREVIIFSQSNVGVTQYPDLKDPSSFHIWFQTSVFIILWRGRAGTGWCPNQSCTLHPGKVRRTRPTLGWGSYECFLGVNWTQRHS